jgi:hypothetical protein
VEVHGYAKQGAGFGYSKVRGLNTLARDRGDGLLGAGGGGSTAAEGVVRCGSPRGAKRLVTDALKRCPG